MTTRRFDVRAAIAADDARREREQRDEAVRVLVDVELEARVLGNMLCAYRFCDCNDADLRCCNPVIVEPETTLSRCADVETDDFTDYRHRATMNALRNLQARGVLVGSCEWPAAIADELTRSDKRTDHHRAQHVDLVYLTDLATRVPRLSRNALDHATRRLRDLAQHRRLA